MTDYAGQFNPGFRLEPARVALVVVDMQYASASRHEGLGRLLKDQGRSEQGTARFDRIESVVVPTIQRLLGAFRERGLRIVYLTVGSELPDFSDLPPHIDGCTSTPGSVSELPPLEKGNGYPAGVGGISSRLNQAVHCPIQVQISVPEHPLDFHYGGERLATDLTLLNRKCVGQKLLKSVLIDAGMATHIAVVADMWIQTAVL